MIVPGPGDLQHSPPTAMAKDCSVRLNEKKVNKMPIEPYRIPEVNTSSITLSNNSFLHAK